MRERDKACVLYLNAEGYADNIVKMGAADTEGKLISQIKMKQINGTEPGRERRQHQAAP